MMKEVGERIAKIRQSRGMKQVEVERRAELATGSLSRIESGTREITMAQAHAIARVLRADITQLYYDGEVLNDGLCAVLADLRASCSPRQRRAFAGMLRTLADELVPASTATE